MPVAKTKTDEALEILEGIQTCQNPEHIPFALARLKRATQALEAVDQHGYFMLSGVCAGYDGDIKEMKRKFNFLHSIAGGVDALNSSVPLCLNLGMYSYAGELIDDLKSCQGLNFYQALAFAKVKLFCGDTDACYEAISYMNLMKSHQEVNPWSIRMLENIENILSIFSERGILPEDFAVFYSNFESEMLKRINLNATEYLVNFDVIDDSIVIYYEVNEILFNYERASKERELFLDAIVEAEERLGSDTSVPSLFMTADMVVRSSEVIEAA